MRELLGSMLRALGCSPTLTASGGEALGLFDTRPFAIVLVDYVMPGLSGPETCRRMKIAKGDSPPCLVGMTGHTEPVVVEEFISAGADEVLRKPFSLAALSRLINELTSSSGA